MKQKACRLIALFLIAALMAGALPVSALAADGGAEEVIFAEITLASHFGELFSAAEYTDTCYYSDSWFLADSSALNYRLATLSAMASAASYSNDIDPRGAKLRDVLEKLGFSGFALNRYYSEPLSTYDSIGCAVASKTILDGAGKPYTLLAVFPRGAGYGVEWVGNFLTGADGLHAGFASARDEMLRFLRQYIAENAITGDLKVWAGGYSRGAAAVNLLGGFLADHGDYLGADVSLAPQDLFVYSIATPLTLPASGVTRGEALRVAGAGSEYDTAGEASDYTGDDRDAPLDLSAPQYGGIFNIIAYGDYLSKLPPASWGFARYGTTITADYGAADLLPWLRRIDPEAAEKLTRYASYAALYPEKTLDPDTLRVSDADSAISPDELVSARVEALMRRAGQRAEYSGGVSEAVLSSLGAIFGSVCLDFVPDLRALGTGELTKAALLNYLAYALEQQGVYSAADAAGHALDAGAADVAGITEVLTQLMDFAGMPSAHRRVVTAQQFLSDLLCFLLYDEAAPERAEVLAQLIPPERAAYANLYRSLTVYANEADTAAAASSGELKTVDDLLLLLAAYVTANPDDENVRVLIRDLSQAAKPYTEPIARLLQKEDGEAEELICELLRACVEGLPCTNTPAKDIRSGLCSLLAGLRLREHKTVAGLVAGVTNPLLLSSLVDDVLDLLLNDETGSRRALIPAANAALNGLLELVRRESISDYVDVVEANPAALRSLAGALIFAPQEGAYTLSDDLRNLLTAADHAALLSTVHFHELYISWLKTMDPGYSQTASAGAGAAPAVLVQSSPFDDVAADEVYYDEVLWAYYHEPQITNGTGAKAFTPDGTVKRGEAMTFLWRASGCPEPTIPAENCSFTDLTEDYYKKAILWAYEKGIAKGISETEFGPEIPLTTAHIATLLFRTVNGGGDGWYEQAAGWIRSSGGWEDIALAIDADTPCPRAQAVMALYAMRAFFSQAA